MNDIELAATEFGKNHKNLNKQYPRNFFIDASASLKSAFSRRRGETELLLSERELYIAARVSLRALRSEKAHICHEKSPYVFLLCDAYFDICGSAATTFSLSEFVRALLPFHDFTVGELLMMRDHAVISCALHYAKDGDGRYLSLFSSLDNVDFETIYLKFAKAHIIFSREKCGVYPNISAETVRLYDEELLSRSGEEISNAKAILEKADAENEHVGKYLVATPKNSENAYFCFVFLLTFLFFALVFLLSSAFVAVISAAPTYILSKEIASMIFDRGGRPLPRIGKGDEIDRTKCTVCITTLLAGEARDGAIFDLIEDCYLTNRHDNFTFAVLADLCEAEKKSLPSDNAVIRHAKARISALNEKYGNRFALFIRRRRFAVCEKKYLGWERKRGAVIELCRYSKGEDGSFETVERGELVRGAAYILTLDSDTRPSEDSVRHLLGIMLHPQNKAVVNKKIGRVVSGYAILQPKMAPSLFSTERSVFARFSNGSGGIDRYSTASFDLYQRIFGRGIFCGKGMIDVDAFLSVCDGFFPRERILSHDLLEGSLARAASVGDVVFTDSVPVGAAGYFSRAERWIRGDLQALIYLLKKVPDQTGKKIKNPMDALSKYMICDNILRAAAPLFSVILVFIASFYGNYAAMFPLIYTVFPLIKTLIFHLSFTGGRSLYFISSTLISSIRSSLFTLMSLAVSAGVFIKAATGVFISAFFTKRGFLSWTTAAEYDDKKKNGMLKSAYIMCFGFIFGALGTIFPMPSVIFGSLWALFPIVSYIFSLQTKKPFAIAEKDRISSYALDMWRYFADHVNESSAHLPPDNVQLSPSSAVAMRTSPTDIGLYLLSLLAARDFGFILTDELLRRTDLAIKSIGSMAKWNGHLYNWYALPSLDVIGVPFVSSVDSGNFITCAFTFCEGVKEYIGEEPDLAVCIKRLTQFVEDADFSALVDTERKLLSVGYDAGAGRLSPSCYDNIISEARTTAYYLQAKGALSKVYYFSLGRKTISRLFSCGVASWSGTAFEYFMPSLFLPSPRNSLMKKSLDYAARAQKRNAVRVPGKNYSVFGVSESCFFEFDANMIYQYRAFGIDALSLDPKTSDESVISPYSSFLMLCESPRAAIKNLSRLNGVNMYGKYGFYEALDLEKKRVGKGYAIIKSFMAHHIGMSIVAAANYCFDGIFVKRFLSDPQMRSRRELLGECAPTGDRTYKKRKEKRYEKIPERKYFSGKAEKARVPTLICPTAAMISNNKTRLILSSSGHISLYDGSDALILSSKNKYSLGGGLRIYARVDKDVYISPVPLGYVSNGFDSSFDFIVEGQKAIYKSKHTRKGKSYSFDVELSVRDDSEILDIICRVDGAIYGCEIAVYFEPVMNREEAFTAHKSFSNLFIESEYHKDEQALVFVHRQRSGEAPHGYLGISSDRAPSKISSEREKLLPLMYGEEDIARLVGKDHVYSDGAVIIPACCYSVNTGNSRKSGPVKFTVGYFCDRDDLLYELSARANAPKVDVSKLQFAVSGGNAETAALERYILEKIIFGAHGVKNAGISDAVSKRPIKIDDLWRHGISGDCETVCALFYDKYTQKDRLRSLLRLFKYSRIRGLAFDLIIICEDGDRYNLPQIKAANDAIKAEGLSSFVGCRAGVFAIESASLSPGERTVMTECSASYFDLSLPFSFYLGKQSGNISDSIIKERLKKSAKPEGSARDALGKCVISKDGVLLKKRSSAPPRAHVIASESFGTVLSENSLGFTYFSNSSLGKLTPHTSDGMREDDGEKIILRIRHGEEYTDIDAAAFADSVIYGSGFSEYRGKAGDVSYKLFVSVDGKIPSKITEVELTASSEKRIDVIYSVTPCAGADVKMRETSVMIEKNRRAVVFSRMINRTGKYFYGMVSSFGENVQIFTDSTALMTDGRIFGDGDDICAICEKVELSGTHKCVFRLSASTTDQFANLIISGDLGSGERLDIGRSSPTVKTDDSERDLLVNSLLPYQTVASRVFARSGFCQVGGAYGFRDQIQDVISLIPYRRDISRRHLICAACHQYEDGSVMHWWHQYGYPHAGIRSRCSDDSAWLSFALCEYVEKTGDNTILNVKTPYLFSPPLSESELERYERAHHSGKRASVLEHALKGLLRTFSSGPHGLALIGTGDWNDGMNRVGRLGRGESVWLAFFSAICAVKLSRIYESEGNVRVINKLLSCASDMIVAAKKTFDGSWFLRGYYDDGTPLGSKNDTECAVDIMPQAFAAIAASEVDGSLYNDAKTALEKSSEILFDRKNSVFRLLWPPFDKGDSSPGYIKGYVPGLRENGGQYTHAAVFAALGMLRVGMNREGAELLFALDPTKKSPDVYKAEQYVIAGDVYANKLHVGRGGWSWYTGAAGWYRTVFIEELCGFRQFPTGFSVFPRFSDLFESFELVVQMSDTVYFVKVRRSEREFIECDGRESDNFFPFDKGSHNVSVFTAGVGFVPPENARLTFRRECDTIYLR